MTRLLIRGKPLALIRQCLEAYCVSAGYRLQPRLFALTVFGYGYSLSSLFSGNCMRIPEVAGLLLLGKVRFLRLPLPAHGLRVKNNIRVFFDGISGSSSPLTAKIALPSEHRSGSLAHEIEARHRLGGRAGGCFAIPRIVRHDTVGSAWLEEDFIESGGGRENEKVRLFLDDVAAPMYRHALTRKSGAGALAMMGSKPEDLDGLQDVLATNRSLLGKLLTVGYIHGDLSPANMILGRDRRLYLIDWELAGMAPVAWDLKKIYSYDPAGTLRLLDELRHESDASAREQMQVALCCQLAGLRKGREKRFAYLTSNRNKSRNVALKMIAKQEKELAEWIAQLGEDQANEG